MVSLNTAAASVVSGRRPDLEQLLGISKGELDSALHCFADAAGSCLGIQ